MGSMFCSCFFYRITIENLIGFRVKLLNPLNMNQLTYWTSRTWTITDSSKKVQPDSNHVSARIIA